VAVAVGVEVRLDDVAAIGGHHPGGRLHGAVGGVIMGGAPCLAVGGGADVGVGIGIVGGVAKGGGRIAAGSHGLGLERLNGPERGYLLGHHSPQVLVHPHDHGIAVGHEHADRLGGASDGIQCDPGQRREMLFLSSGQLRRGGKHACLDGLRLLGRGVVWHHLNVEWHGVAFGHPLIALGHADVARCLDAHVICPREKGEGVAAIGIRHHPVIVYPEACTGDGRAGGHVGDGASEAGAGGKGSGHISRQDTQGERN